MTLKKCPVLYGRGSCHASYERVMCHTSLFNGFNTGLSGAGVIQACHVSYEAVRCWCITRVPGVIQRFRVSCEPERLYQKCRCV